MKFRPCIDIHGGLVKQIVGGSLTEKGAAENFSTDKGAAFYAGLYRRENLPGGHVIILDKTGSESYPADLAEAVAALEEYPGGLQLGGGITAENAAGFLDRGASHVIVTSYVFQRGNVNFDNLKRLAAAVGRERLVIDLSCRRRGGEYIVVTDRWQKFTDVAVTPETLDIFSRYCSEFLVHAADAEGKREGIEKPLAALLGSWGKCPVTYAGGIGSYEDIEELRRLGGGALDFTVGSALDLFGGALSLEKILELTRD